MKVTALTLYLAVLVAGAWFGLLAWSAWSTLRG